MHIWVFNIYSTIQFYRFVDSYSQMGETGDEDDSDEDEGPFSLFEGTGYGRQELDDLSSESKITNQNLRELAKMHALYKTLAGQTPLSNDHEPKLQPSTLIEILSNSKDSLLEEQKENKDYMNIYSDVNKTILSEDIKINTPSYMKINSNVEYHGNRKWISNGPTDVVISQVKSVCDKQEYSLPYIPQPVYMLSSSKESGKSSQSSLIKNRSETSASLSDFNTLDEENVDSSIDLMINDRVPSNGVSVPDFIEDLEANVVLCNPVQYNYSIDGHLNEIRDDHTTLCGSDDDSDCLSNVSEDSEYMIRASKFSKFLCVGVGKNKSKTPYKVTKQNLKNESKKNSKMKDTSKTKFQVKSRDSSKSPEFNSKNLLKSPSRAFSQNLSKSSSSGSGSSSSGTGWKSSHPGGGLKGGHWEAKSHNGGAYTSSSFSYQQTPVGSYDSGLESSVIQSGSTPQDVPTGWNSPVDKKPKVENQRFQIQPGVASKSGTNSSLATTPSLGESSGYGSMARDSECSSFSSSQDSEMDEELRKENSRTKELAKIPIKVEKYTEEDIQRYEGRSRTAECLHLQKEQREQNDILVLKARQKQLKSELAEAKKNLSVSDKSWSYERKSNVRIPLVCFVYFIIES